MTSLDITDPVLEPVTLDLAQRVTLGSRRQPPDEQPGRIALGRPVCLPLDLATVDEEARIFLSGRPDSAFWLLALVCSFRAVEDEPMESAWLNVRLRTVRPAGAEPPTAWSMEPLALADAVEVSKTVSLDAELKLTSVLVPIEVGPSAGREWTRSYERSETYVQAHAEGSAQPSWFFTRTPVREIDGVHRLRTVVELPATAVGEAEVSVGATLKLKRCGLIPYRTDPDRVPAPRTVRLERPSAPTQ
ncbi:hypothetical protein [Streptomyces cyanogenus]|uniref:Uncharacterized protein n=1 Tax=Streptomyces cyanogenus TaxID=80860 RepID=A0ABX7TW16_STRCY|nr:hypothetical protein [Streptomyces cyanogenus]QTE00782.1 hypothetical protein S1361_25850 [Streptomyces cyanogenus]